MSGAGVDRHDQPELSLHLLTVLGLIVDGKVARDDAYRYRAQGRTDEIDAEIYDLEKRFLVTLRPDGRVAPTTTGSIVWRARRPRHQPAAGWRTPQFTSGENASLAPASQDR
ncbi:hypothetical protein [Actinoplanes sp. NPDC026623]|uniref:hypothetical protein n=1 Tax=Actinoplanes sp. NPDC026623 TaxID=3155610 RepID=UPI003403714C